MYKLKVKINNVSLRAFLFLLDQRNLKNELSNTTICDYIINIFGQFFTGKYKDLISFRSGYAGNLSLIFDSAESQTGELNKYNKVLDPILCEVFKKMRTVKVTFEDEYCYIYNIADHDSYMILSVFFNLKPINSLINRKVNLNAPFTGWLSIVSQKLNLNTNDLLPHPALETGRGKRGALSILNRYTIYNYGQNWFDVIKPTYYNFKNLRYKFFLRSLLIEQDNFYYIIMKTSNYDLDYNELFHKVIDIVDFEPKLKGNILNQIIDLNDIFILKKDSIASIILDNITLPKSYQYMFTLVEENMVFEDGTIIDLSPFLIENSEVLKESRSLNPNISYEVDKENIIKEKVKKGLKGYKSLDSRLRRLSMNGEESHTVLKFIAKSFQGKILINDYSRDENGAIRYGTQKTCLILYNGTKYPDMVCIFLEDAEKIEKQCNRSLSEFSEFIWHNIRRFEHLFFEVEAEHNLSSFKSHDNSLKDVLLSKYIFCEHMTGDSYNSKFGVEIPAISIKDL